MTRAQVERQAAQRGGVATPWVDLIAAVIRETPKLDGGACKSLPPQLFDGDTEDDIVAATAACRACPVLDACRTWALDDDSGITTGIVGALVLDVPHERKSAHDISSTDA